MSGVAALDSAFDAQTAFCRWDIRQRVTAFLDGPERQLLLFGCGKRPSALNTFGRQLSVLTPLACSMILSLIARHFLGFTHQSAVVRHCATRFPISSIASTDS